MSAITQNQMQVCRIGKLMSRPTAGGRRDRSGSCRSVHYYFGNIRQQGRLAREEVAQLIRLVETCSCHLVAVWTAWRRRGCWRENKGSVSTGAGLAAIRALGGSYSVLGGAKISRMILQWRHHERAAVMSNFQDAANPVLKLRFAHITMIT